jgi:hypothetical protein
MATATKINLANLNDVGEIMRHVGAGAVDAVEASARVAELLAQAKAAGVKEGKSNGFAGGKITLKIGLSGAASLYGLQRMPVTLYKRQWERLFTDEVKAQVIGFLESNPTTVVTLDSNERRDSYEKQKGKPHIVGVAGDKVTVKLASNE